jgi:murein DD-endopeptidase MepM/ murein hydrolase activator NlpD
MFTRIISAVIVLALGAAGAAIPAAPGGAQHAGAGRSALFDALIAADAEKADERWLWPASPVRIAAPYLSPPHPYAPGHRGIDLEAPAGAALRAPADGVVAFVGRVVDREVLTIDHGAGIVSTLEPVRTPLKPGDRVAAGDAVATVDVGGHSAVGTVHLGVRRDGEYVNPLEFYGGVPRAVLLPCCEGQPSAWTTLRAPLSLTAPTVDPSTVLSLPLTDTVPTPPSASISLRSPLI